MFGFGLNRMTILGFDVRVIGRVPLLRSYGMLGLGLRSMSGISGFLTYVHRITRNAEACLLLYAHACCEIRPQDINELVVKPNKNPTNQKTKVCRRKSG